MTRQIRCVVCEDGELWADVALRRGLAEHGWIVQGVLGDERNPPLAYTVGLTKWALPEVLVYDLDLSYGTGLLNELAHRLVAGEVFGNGAHLHDLDPCGHCFRLFDVPGPGAPVHTARNLYGEGVRVRQLLVPDENGRLPWQRHYVGSRQPLHFTPPPR